MSRASLARNGLPLSISKRVCRVAPRCFSISTTRATEHHDNRLRFPGALEAKFTTDLKFENPRDKGVIPCYRVIDSEGVVVDQSYKRDLSDDEAVKLYTNMLGVSIMDLICLDAQRQGMRYWHARTACQLMLCLGRISFYMVSSGEVSLPSTTTTTIDAIASDRIYRKVSALVHLQL